MLKRLRFYAVVRRHIRNYKQIIRQYCVALDACTLKIEELERDLKEERAITGHLLERNRELKQMLEDREVAA